MQIGRFILIGSCDAGSVAPRNRKRFWPDRKWLSPDRMVGRVLRASLDQVEELCQAREGLGDDGVTGHVDVANLGPIL